ncbi:MAG TPA: glycosyl transferase [Lachnospiraceae bacterium]|nr:glycosyl transferase [Lachnospiraceae bacterium]
MSTYLKKICHMTSAHEYNDMRIFLKECRTLHEAGYNVSFIVQHNKDEVIDGVQILGVAKPKNRKERMLKTTRQVYKRALECDADIYHFHDPELIIVGLRLKKSGKKVIYDVHEDVPRQILSKQWISIYLRKVISWLVEMLENYAAKWFDYIITATPYIKERFVKINKKTIDVNNYPILSELYISETNWSSSREKLVCYIGGISKNRGIQEMVQALEKSHYFMLLAGNFESSDEREMLINKDGWRQVIELGYINRAEVKDVLSRARAGLVLFLPEPNHIHAQPNKLFEYMSAGIPVIGSDFPLWREIIESNNCGICVNPFNPNEIAYAIDWLIENPYQAEQMGSNGRKSVEDKYNWEKESKKILKVYEELYL